MIEQLARDLAEIFEDVVDATLWLFTPNVSLHDESPAQLWIDGDYDDVLALVDALVSGAVL